MPEFEIPHPVKGKSIDEGFDRQPEFTVRECENVVEIEPATGRRRIAQREGLSKYASTQFDTGDEVDHLQAVTVHNKSIDYSRIAGGSEVFTAATTATQTDTFNVIHDDQGNAYAIDGFSTVVKFNADLEEVFNLQVPVDDDKHQLEGMALSANGLLFVGVGSGGNQRRSKIFCYEPIPDESMQILWEVEIEGYCPALEWKDGLLFAVVNFPDKNLATVIAYDRVDTVEPVVKWTAPNGVPHPATDIAVHPKTGDLFICSEENTRRQNNPLSPDSSPIAVDWTPNDLTNAEERIWAWYDAEEIANRFPGIEDGDDVLIWHDKSGNNRHLFSQEGVNLGGARDGKSPTYAESGLSGKPTLRFDFDASVAAAMVSGVNPSTAVEAKSSNRTMLPGYQGAMYAVFMVVRPDQSATPKTVIAQENEDTSGSPAANELKLLLDRDDDTTTGGAIEANDAGEAGSVFLWEKTDSGGTDADGGAGTDGNPLKGSYDANSRAPHAALISFLCDGNETLDTGENTRSMFRVNGIPYDRYHSQPTEGLGPTYVGYEGFNISTGTQAFMVGDICEILVLDRFDAVPGFIGDADAVLSHQLYPDSADAGDPDDEWSRIEGYLAWKWGIAHELADGEGPSNTYTHTYLRSAVTTSQGPPSTNTITGLDNRNIALKALTTIPPLVTKLRATNGEVVWVDGVTYNDPGGGTLELASGGYGYGIAVDDENGVFTLGPNAVGSTEALEGGTLRRLTDPSQDAPPSTGWTSALTGSSDNFTHKRFKIKVDNHGQVYYPLARTTDTTGLTVRRNDTGAEIVSVSLPDDNEGYAVSFETPIVDYDGDLDEPDDAGYSTSTAAIADKVWVGCGQGTGSDVDDLYEVQLVDMDANTDALREVYVLGAAGGSLKRIEAGSPGTVTEIDATAFDSSSQFIDSAVLFGKVYFTDGTAYTVLDPKDTTDSAAGTLSAFKSTTGGKITRFGQLMTAWRRRIVIARFAEDPHNWAMSAENAPTDWNLAPAVVRTDQAANGTNAETGTGRDSDIINTLVPINDDLLIMGGDSTIHVMRGNPFAGGQIDLISDKVGMSFGRPWCKDDRGNLYFYGSRGGFYVMDPRTGATDHLSKRLIDRELQDEVDLSTHYVLCEYDYRRDAVKILQVPFGAGGTIVKGWTYSTKNGGFWPLEFGDTDVQPTSLLVVDGDTPSDRLTLIGCEDGYVRQFDEDAANDDTDSGSTTVPIDAFITYGPLPTAGEGVDTLYDVMQVVLGEVQGGVHWELLGADTAEKLGPVLADGTLFPGQNEWTSIRRAATRAYLRFRNNDAGQRFAIEKIVFEAFAMGRRRRSG